MESGFSAGRAPVHAPPFGAREGYRRCVPVVSVSAFMNDTSAMVFLCDYLRLLTLGTDNPHEVEALMDEEIETHHTDEMRVPSALQTVADAMPVARTVVDDGASGRRVDIRL